MTSSSKCISLVGVFALVHLMVHAATPTAALSTIVGSKQYYVGVAGKVNWFRANQLCAVRGMTLAAIESATEAKNVGEFLFANEVYTSQFWLSGNDLPLRTDYNWLGTGSKFGYTNWAAQEPSLDPNRRCVYINGSGKWVKASCYTENYYICSKPVVPECGAYGTCLYTFTPNF